MLSYCRLVLQKYVEEYDDHRSKSDAWYTYVCWDALFLLFWLTCSRYIIVVLKCCYFALHLCYPPPPSQTMMYMFFFPYLYNRRWCCVDLYIFFHLIWREEVQGHGCQHSKFLDFVLFALIHLSIRLPILLRRLFFFWTCRLFLGLNVVHWHTYQCTVEHEPKP